MCVFSRYCKNCFSGDHLSWFPLLLPKGKMSWLYSRERAVSIITRKGDRFCSIHCLSLSFQLIETPALHILVLFDKSKAQLYSCRVRKILHDISYLLMCLSGRNFNNFNSPPLPHKLRAFDYSLWLGS